MQPQQHVLPSGLALFELFMCVKGLSPTGITWALHKFPRAPPFTLTRILALKEILEEIAEENVKVGLHDHEWFTHSSRYSIICWRVAQAVGLSLAPCTLPQPDPLHLTPWNRPRPGLACGLLPFISRGTRSPLPSRARQALIDSGEKRLPVSHLGTRSGSLTAQNPKSLTPPLSLSPFLRFLSSITWLDWRTAVDPGAVQEKRLNDREPLARSLSLFSPGDAERREREMREHPSR